MTKYHPIDVRYKGPSTAYRGSSKRPSGTMTSLRDETSKQPAKANPATHAGKQHSPWDGQTKRQAATSPSMTSQENQRSTASISPTAGGIGGVFSTVFGLMRTIKNIYLAIIVLIFLMAFVF